MTIPKPHWPKLPLWRVIINWVRRSYEDAEELNEWKVVK